MLSFVFKKFWKTVDAKDRKRIAGQTPTVGIKEIVDIPYIDDGTWQHKLDVYYKEGTQSKQPVIIDIHGGGWMYGTKEINKYYNLVLASRGYTVVSINYRLVPNADISDQIRDCFSAYKWISKNIDKYYGDLSNVFLTGDSAGGFLAAHTAIINTSDKLKNVYNVENCGLEFNAIGLTSPVCYLETNTIEKVYYNVILGKNYKTSPYFGLVNLDRIIQYGTMPPTFFVTSTGDFIARKATEKAYLLLKENNVRAEYMYWYKTDNKNLPHVFSVIDPYSTSGVKTIDKMISFFNMFKKAVVTS